LKKESVVYTIGTATTQKKNNARNPPDQQIQVAYMAYNKFFMLNPLK
jgi:hypothetical protein